MPARRRRQPGRYRARPGGAGGLVAGDVHLAVVKGVVPLSGSRQVDDGGKERPVVLVRSTTRLHSSSQWWVIGLTTNAVYDGGGTRIPLVDWRDAGLLRPSWAWSGRLTRLPLDAIGERVGRLSQLDLHRMAHLIRVHDREAADVLAALSGETA